MVKKSIQSVRGTTYYWINQNIDNNAKCIVFTHGLTANHIMFEKQVDFFKQDYTIITWDIPLHGESRPYKDFSYYNTALDLSAILESENIKKAVLVGMSMGGYPCQEFAVQFPEKVLAFVALDTTPFGHGYYSEFDKWLLKRVKSMVKWFPEKTLKKESAKLHTTTKYAHDLMLKMLEPLSKNDIAEQMGIAYGKFIDENKDTHFNFPVLILVGEHDKTGNVKKYSEAWAKKEGYPLKLIKNAAHLSNADNSVDVNNEILEFIKAL
jgi:pimeloyl-ACP methyl ester carboxylesterase